jgi:hypothetical protein
MTIFRDGGRFKMDEIEKVAVSRVRDALGELTKALSQLEGDLSTEQRRNIASSTARATNMIDRFRKLWDANVYFTTVDDDKSVCPKCGRPFDD